MGKTSSERLYRVCLNVVSNIITDSRNLNSANRFHTGKELIKVNELIKPQYIILFFFINIIDN